MSHVLWSPEYFYNLLIILSLLLDVENVRLATVVQENAVLKSELEMLKLKYKNLIEENKRLRQASVNIVRWTLQYKEY